MSKQTRWLCSNCSRQWVSARMFTPTHDSRKWEEGDPCPACHSMDISKVAYDPPFPGGDIQVGDEPVSIPDGVDLTTTYNPDPVAEETFRNTMKQVDKMVNRTLEMSSSIPEFD